MTNEQLKILLESQAQLLEKAIEKSAELMPVSAEREMVTTYVGPEFTKEPSIKNMNQNINPQNWEEQPKGRYLALIPMYDHLELLRVHIMNLMDSKLVAVCAD